MIIGQHSSDTEPDRVQRTTVRWTRIHRAAIASGPWILLAVAICLQAQAGRAYLPSDLIGSDPPAHFVTGVMLYDFLRYGRAIKPMHFAECFYAQYPKVALGHWPPVFYVLQAIWYMAFGATITAARWLCATIAAWSSWMLYRRCRMHLGRWHGIAAAGLFLAMPVVLTQSWDVMSDLLVAGFAFCAICSLSDFMESGDTKGSLYLALWSTLAILTKGTGWLLVVVIGAAPLVCGQIWYYSRWRYWLSFSLIIIASAPFYIVTNALDLGYPLNRRGYVHNFLSILREMSYFHWAAAILGILGLLLGMRWWLKRGPLRFGMRTALLMGTWCFTLIGFIVLFPLTAELGRYFINGIAPGIFILASLLFALEQRSGSVMLLNAELVAVLGCAVICASIPKTYRLTTAYSRALKAIPASKEPRLILLAGDGYVEGSIIAADINEKYDHSTYFIRSSKFTASSNWDGSIYSLRYESPESLGVAIDEANPDYIVLDKRVAPKPGVAMLEKVLANQSKRWKPIDREQVDLDGRHRELIVLHHESNGESKIEQGTVPPERQQGGMDTTCKADKIAVR